MASHVLVGVLIILRVTIHLAGACTEQVVDAGKQNVQLVFSFDWNNGETKLVNCFQGNYKIGDCLELAGIFCQLLPTSLSVYTMSSNGDLTEVYVTIVTFNSTRSGNYSCSKDTGTTTITICVKDSATTASTPDDAGWTIQCTFGIVVGCIGVILMIVWVYLMIVWIILCCKEENMNGGWVARCIGICGLGVLGIGLLIAMTALLAERVCCKQGSTARNYAGLAIGGIGDILLVVCSCLVKGLPQNSKTDLGYTEHRKETGPRSVIQQATCNPAGKRPFNPLTQTATSSVSPGHSTTVQGANKPESGKVERPVSTSSLSSKQVTLANQQRINPNQPIGSARGERNPTKNNSNNNG